MFKGNSIVLYFSILIILVILLFSMTPEVIKALLIISTIGLLFPAVRNRLIRNKGRKLKVALYTSLTFSIGFTLLLIVTSGTNIDSPNIFEFIVGFIGAVLFILFYSSLGVFFYGLPASLLAEYISERFFSIRFLVSGLILLGFGLASYLLMPEFMLFAFICSVIFFFFDEVTRRRVMNAY
ncbi:hypothetical protein FIU87_02740 [Bacillus sp. THAF10]|uniref:hypothetical protein n=1 Tax=Bacillus sp. THAF10 TaxID=2587848 RepID=UPI00126946F9|nr:hypothetical protein [Bacillus sp. THAF10]QFT87558.1 hypothetical protein FIU87_02740 [Bacillus sp. THAF10]